LGELLLGLEHNVTRAVGPHGENKFPFFILTAIADNVDSFAFRSTCHPGYAGPAATG
jgi:hypothetical protein